MLIAYSCTIDTKINNIHNPIISMRDEPILPCLFLSQISYSLKQNPSSHSSYFPKSSDNHFY
ncbi:hypothetical protein H8356DRAFT_291978 [Neocallimastix lanati (nom. inval.)]|nr:hypothetical protein H8356DRAFT_291978 [Neocallimastix sp. JGI-2020a]